ncbi:MAG: hypothetical protein NC301_05825 [Bacteroides sp.]|nr:hypothetical protein [Bacteroides sp.]MCM1379866.1 hypothetical protein [Bacteroides sp.]MCM1446102.1 hypothetical protein [Prevotella sp.]
MHCHIIPGVDDGSPDVETSLTLLVHMSRWGLKRIFASPHSTQDRYENTPQSLAKPFAELKDAIQAKQMSIELHHHMEYRIDDFFLRQFDNDNIVTLPENFLLIENSFSHEPWGMNNVVYDLINHGYNPILAHPERYAFYALHHRDRYKDLHNMGVYFQVNLLSLAGHYGKMERETAVYLLKQGMVQFIGTDLHRMSHVETITRYLSSRQYQRDLKLFDNLRNDTL